MNTAIFDAGYMARRAYYAMGRGRRFENSTTFGFLRDVLSELEFLQATRAVFCFDSMHSERRRVAPDYKISRNRRYAKMSPEEKNDEVQFHIEVVRLPKLLKQIGYSNIFQQDGYEADDLIASAVRHFPERLFLVSSDRDLWQLLGPHVSCWNPQTKKLTSERSFFRSFAISPDQWVAVKAIAGCNTDDISGVVGVGEKTAVRYLRGGLLKKSMLHERIRTAEKTIAANRVLVRLPFPGTMKCEPGQPSDNPTAAGWAAVADKLDMPGILDRKRFAGIGR